MAFQLFGKRNTRFRGMLVGEADPELDLEVDPRFFEWSLQGLVPISASLSGLLGTTLILLAFVELFELPYSSAISILVGVILAIFNVVVLASLAWRRRLRQHERQRFLLSAVSKKEPEFFARVEADLSRIAVGEASR